MESGRLDLSSRNKLWGTKQLSKRVNPIPADPECGRAAEASGRIANGTETSIREFPWMESAQNSVNWGLLRT